MHILKFVRLGLHTFSLLALLASCNKAPDGVLPEQEMRKVLSDMHIAESMVANDFENFPDDESKEALYASVFKKNNTDRSVYDSSLVWYGKNIDILMPIYDLAISDLDKRIAELGDIQADAFNDVRKDSVDIWTRKRMLAFRSSNIFNGTTFNIKPKSSYNFGSRFVLEAEVWGLRPRMKSQIHVCIFAEQVDTTLMVEQLLTKDGTYQIELQTLKTQRINRVYGSIFFDKPDTTYGGVYLDKLRLMKYNYK